MKREFFLQSAPQLAQQLIGCILVHRTVQGERSGMIVETEAYDQDDPASHSCRGRTARNHVMFKAGGFAYVYRSYGIHWCLNVSAGPVDFGAAVLLRALEPQQGLEAMAKSRGFTTSIGNERNLCRGPGRLTQAMAIDGTKNGACLTAHDLIIRPATQPIDQDDIITTTRIGISQGIDIPWRFCLTNNAFVSGKKLLQ